MTGVSPRYARMTESESLARLRRVFRRLNVGMVLMWRLGLGPLAGVWPRVLGRIMVIEHVGRHSGRRYRTPVNYSPDAGDVFCVAAFGDRTDWFKNLVAEPRILVWLPDGRWEATAIDASGDPERLTRIRSVLVDSGFAAPLFGLHPKRMTNAELASEAAAYRLVRIHIERRAPSKASPRPGDLAWLLAMSAFGTVVLRRRLTRTRVRRPA